MKPLFIIFQLGITHYSIRVTEIHPSIEYTVCNSTGKNSRRNAIRDLKKTYKNIKRTTATKEIHDIVNRTWGQRPNDYLDCFIRY